MPSPIPGLVQTVAPTDEPVTLDEVKEFLRLDTDGDISTVSGLMKAARRWVEVQTGRQLMPATWQYTLDTFPPVDRSAYLTVDPRYNLPQNAQLQGAGGGTIRLPTPPVQSVSSVQYIDTQGVLQTLDPTGWLLDATTQPARLSPSYGNVWPITRYTRAAVKVTYVAGYADQASVPDTFKLAIKLLCQKWYYRDPSIIEDGILGILNLDWYGEIV